MIILFVSFGIFTIFGFYTIGIYANKIHDHSFIVSNASLNLAIKISEIHLTMNEIIWATSPKELNDKVKNIQKLEKTAYQHLDIIKQQIQGKQGKLYEKQTKHLFEKSKAIRQEVISLVTVGNVSRAEKILKRKGQLHLKKLRVKTFELSSCATKKSADLLDIAYHKREKFEETTIVITLLGVLLFLIIAVISINFVKKTEQLLKDKNEKIQLALDEVKTLRGILPICSFCKKIRDDKGYYKQIEEYIHDHTGVDFSHTVCPSCAKKYYSEFI